MGESALPHHAFGVRLGGCGQRGIPAQRLESLLLAILIGEIEDAPGVFWGLRTGEGGDSQKGQTGESAKNKCHSHRLSSNC
jgi:hypothetical protein